MSRCSCTTDLVVCHISADSPFVNKVKNAHILCRSCLKEAMQFGAPDPESGDLPEFSEFAKEMALQKARNQCECIRLSGCHSF